MPQREPRKMTNVATLYNQGLTAVEPGAAGEAQIAVVYDDTHTSRVRTAIRPHHSKEARCLRTQRAAAQRGGACRPQDAQTSLPIPPPRLVFEGESRRETDASTLAAVAAAYDAGGWPAQARGDHDHRALQRSERGTWTLVVVPVPDPHRVRRRSTRTAWRDSLGLLSL